MRTSHSPAFKIGRHVLVLWACCFLCHAYSRGDLSTFYQAVHPIEQGPAVYRSRHLVKREVGKHMDTTHIQVVTPVMPSVLKTATHQIIEQFIPKTANHVQKQEIRGYLNDVVIELQNILEQVKTVCDTFNSKNQRPVLCENSELYQCAHALIQNIMENPGQLELLSKKFKDFILDRRTESVEKIQDSLRNILKLLQKLERRNHDDSEESRTKGSSTKPQFDTFGEKQSFSSAVSHGSTSELPALVFSSSNVSAATSSSPTSPQVNEIKVMSTKTSAPSTPLRVPFHQMPPSSASNQETAKPESLDKESYKNLESLNEKRKPFVFHQISESSYGSSGRTPPSYFNKFNRSRRQVQGVYFSKIGREESTVTHDTSLNQSVNSSQDSNVTVTILPPNSLKLSSNRLSGAAQSNISVSNVHTSNNAGKTVATSSFNFPFRPSAPLPSSSQSFSSSLINMGQTESFKSASTNNVPNYEIDSSDLLRQSLERSLRTSDNLSGTGPLNTAPTSFLPNQPPVFNNAQNPSFISPSSNGAGTSNIPPMNSYGCSKKTKVANSSPIHNYDSQGSLTPTASGLIQNLEAPSSVTHPTEGHLLQNQGTINNAEHPETLRSDKELREEAIPLGTLKSAVKAVICSHLNKTTLDIAEEESLSGVISSISDGLIEALSETFANPRNDSQCPVATFKNAASAILRSLKKLVPVEASEDMKKPISESSPQSVTPFVNSANDQAYMIPSTSNIAENPIEIAAPIVPNSLLPNCNICPIEDSATLHSSTLTTVTNAGGLSPVTAGSGRSFLQYSMVPLYINPYTYTPAGQYSFLYNPMN